MVKRILYSIISILYVFLSAYFMPAFFLYAFNFGKGIQNNEDGILLIPVGFFLIVLTVLTDVLLVRNAFKMSGDSLRNKLLIVAVLAVILIVAVIVTFSSWTFFFECLGHFKGLNLGTQR